MKSIFVVVPNSKENPDNCVVTTALNVKHNYVEIADIDTLNDEDSWNKEIEDNNLQTKPVTWREAVDDLKADADNQGLSIKFTQKGADFINFHYLDEDGYKCEDYPLTLRKIKID